MSFTRVPFEEVFADESGGNVKTPQGEYLPAGSFPVVDQGKALIGGYVNDASRLCGGGKPAIIFGDHTRCVKYVDFPFCMGADGVKVLRPKIDADLKYLYHYLQTVRLPDGGYDRHYKYLKRTEVVIPPVSDQRRIAAILDQADALRAKRREALALLDELQRGIFIEMFGDPSSLGWPEVSLGEVTDTLTGFAFRSEEYVECNTEAVRLCRGVNVLPGRIDWSDTAWWPLRKVIGLEKFGLAVGDVVLAMDRPWISEGFKITRVSERDCPSLLVQRVTRIRGGELADEKFIYHLLKQPAFAHHCKPTETTVPHISPKEIRSYKFRLPPVALQTDFSRRIGFVEKLLDSMNAALVCSDALFATLQHRAFRGEL